MTTRSNEIVQSTPVSEHNGELTMSTTEFCEAFTGSKDPCGMNDYDAYFASPWGLIDALGMHIDQASDQLEYGGARLISAAKQDLRNAQEAMEKLSRHLRSRQDLKAILDSMGPQ